MPRARTDEGIAVFAETLRDTLERDFACCQLEPGKERTVNRIHYRKLIGLNWWDKYPLTEAVFDEFDQRISLAVRRTPEELAVMEAWLRERLSEQSLDFHSDRISRRQFGDAFGLDIKKIDREEPEISQLLSRWDTELGASGYKPDKEAVRSLKVDMSRSPPVTIRSLFRIRQEKTTSRRTAEILEEILEEDFQNDKLVLLPSGVISRQHYAARLGMEKGAMSYYRPLFSRYEHLLGGLNERYESDIPTMKAWLDEQIDAGTLEFRGGKFDRSKFCEMFSIKFQGRLTGTPHLRKLVLETDQRLRESGYRSGISRSEIESIRQLLVDPITNSDKLHVNQAHLSKVTGIARSRLHHAPFRPMIVEAENRIIESIKRDGTKIFKYGKVFDFSPLVAAGWSLEFTGRIKTIFEERLGHRTADYLKVSERVVISFFSFLGTSTQPAIIQAASAIREQKDVPHAIWTQTILAYGRGVIADKSARNGHSAASGINTILAEFGAAGIIPDAEVTVPLPPRKTTPRKTLAEIFTPQEADGKNAVAREPRTQKLIAFTKWVLMQSSVPREEQTSFENQGFLVVLESELDKSDSLPDDPVEAIMEIMAKRLDLISKTAQNHVTFWYQHYQYGQKLLSRGISPRRYERFLPNSANDYSENIPRLREFFPSLETGDEGLCNLLRLIANRRNRIFPALSPTSEDELYRSRVIREAIQAYGGIEKLQAYLLPHRFAVASTIVLYLVDSGANVAVARTLTIRAIEAGDGPEFAKLTGKKSKAKGKPIILNLLEDSASIRAMRWIIAAFKAVRKQLSPALSTAMFLRRVGSSLREIDEAWFGTWFRETFCEIEGLAGVAASMIRPSVILKHSLENDGDLRTGLAYGQHSEEVGGVYQNRLITQFLRENLWNKFAHLTESIIIHNKVGLQKLLGVSAEDNVTRVAEVKRTGLGGFCTTGGCAKLNCWDKCPKHAVIADAQLMADLQIWNSSLKEVEGDWIRDHIERWEQEWFPWLWYTEVIGQKMRQGSVGLRRIWNEATKIKDTMIAQPGFVMPRPF